MTTKRPKRRPTKSTDVRHGDIRVLEPKLPAHIKRLIGSRKTIRLDVGCGRNKMGGPDVIGLDIRSLPGVDIVHDLVEDMPWPLPSNIARAVFMSHFFEHVKPWRTLALMAEIHRVCRHDAQVLVAGPYGNEFRFVQDPTHCNESNEATWMYWDRLHPSGLWAVYEPPCFHLESYDILPAGSSRDFNAILRVCKAETDDECKKSHEIVYART